MNRTNRLFAAPAAVVASWVVAAIPASGAVIEPGFYGIGNHPAFQAGPAGLQLDELYDVTPQWDRFLFDFDHPQSLMIAEVSETVIRVYGTAYGGRWNYNLFHNDAYRGMYTIDMRYTIGVQLVPGDDDLWVNGPNNINQGTIVTPLGDTISLWDERGDLGFSLRLGDENNDLGHNGFAGMSGWGWINHGTDPSVHRAVGDLLFTSRGLIPAPGAGAVALIGGMLLVLRRRR